MAQKYSQDELNSLSKETLMALFLNMQDQAERLNNNMETLIEQLRVANQNRFGKHTEKLSEIVGQLSLFNEAEFYSDQTDEDSDESEEELFVRKKAKKKKQKGKREEDLSGFPQEPVSHPVTDAEADAYFGAGCWKRMKPDEYPKEFYRDYNGILMTDGLKQYHLIEDELDGLINANCWVHARRDFAEAVKAIGKSNPKAQQESIAYEALRRIAEFYTLEGEIKDLSAEERLKRRQRGIKSLVEDFFVWVKETVAEGNLIKGKTLSGLNYCINHEKQLKVFLTDGNVPLDNSLSERSIRPFTIGRKNWVIINTPRGAEASAIIYSIVETAKLNGLVPFHYFDHLLAEIPKLIDKNGNIDTAKLDQLLPWSEILPEICRKPRRQ